MKKKISAIITTYKRERHIVERAVRSVLIQDYRPLELVVVDDNREDAEGTEYSGQLEDLCSRSGLDALLDGGAAGTDVEVRLVRTSGGRHGAQAARNTGIEQSGGDVLAFLDDDDEWLEGKLTLQAKLLEEHPDAGMIFCRGWRVDHAYDPPYVNDFQGRAFRSRVRYMDLLRGDCIGTTSQAMIPRSTFDRVGMFDEELPARQDYEMWIRIARSLPVYGSTRHLFRYHKNEEGEQITRSWERCIRGHLLLYKKYKKDIDSDKAARFNVIFYLAHYHMSRGDRRRMVKYYLKALCTSPVEFFKKGMLKLESIQKDRELRGRNA